MSDTWPSHKLGNAAKHVMRTRSSKLKTRRIFSRLDIPENILEEEQKTLMSGLDLDINLCQDLMSRSHVRISCRDQMCIFQLDFPCFLLSISQYLAICIYHCPFQFDFPFLLGSISQNWNFAFTNAFLGWIS